jgi:dethiobiotin synthetase
MSRGARGLFVTGTDTGVGKTLVACALARGLVGLGLDVGVMKPVETGVGAAGPADARALREAAGSSDPLSEICPEPLALAAAPAVAARHEGRRIDPAALARVFRRLSARHEWLLVEGAGGLLAPVAPGQSMADLARGFGLPLLVVARAALGTINHTLLTLEAAVSRGLPVAGVVISHAGGPLSRAEAANLAELRSALGPGLLGEMPALSPGAPVPESAFDLPALLERLGPGFPVPKVGK